MKRCLASIAALLFTGCIAPQIAVNSRADFSRIHRVAVATFGGDSGDANSVARQRAEASLLASEARNQALLRAMPDLMFVLSPEGVYLDCHYRDESELLIPPQQFLGRNVDEVLRVLDGLQTDELCACNWKNGEETLTAALKKAG